MTNKPESSPAFPHLHDSCQRINESEHHEGLTKREWYAGMALQGFCANQKALKENADYWNDFLKNVTSDTGDIVRGQLALVCFSLADAMIEQGEKP